MIKKILPSFLLASGLLVAMIFLRMQLPVFFADIPLHVFDLYQKIHPRIYREAPVAVIDIDDESLSRLGQWPWPRTQLSRLLDHLHKLGAKTLVLDVVFAEPDRTSPFRVLPLLPKTPELEALLSTMSGKLPDHDKILAKTLAQYNSVTTFILANQENTAKPAVKSGFAFAGDDPKPYLPKFRGAVSNLPMIEKAAKGNGSANFIAERDGIIRRVPLVFRLRDEIYPALATEAVRVYQDASTYIVKTGGASGEMNFGEKTGLINLRVGNYTIPTDSVGRIWLYDLKSHDRPVYPVWKILDENPKSKILNGKIVFLGASAAGLKDLRATPLHSILSGTWVHAAIAEQILLREYLYRPDWASGAEVLCTVILGLALALLLPALGAASCAILGAVAVITIWVFSWMAFKDHRLLVDPFLPSAAAFIVYLSVTLMNYLRTEKDKQQIRGAFSRYLSPDFVEKLAENPSILKLGGESRMMTVLFSDVRGFTTLSEKFNPEDLTVFLNRYLTPMTDIILKKKGTIDKYIGDCIMAFWNAPLADREHASNGCRAAFEMRENLKKWNVEMSGYFKKTGTQYTDIKIGIGVNTGPCCVGNMGSEQRFDYSVLGDDVNLASRLEGLSSLYGVTIVLGAATYEEIKDRFAAIELDLIQVKGKTKPAKIYTLLGLEETKKSEAFVNFLGAHEKMLEAYRRKDWETALAQIKACRESWLANSDLSALYQLYENRIEAFRTAPPPADWNGAAISHTK